MICGTLEGNDDEQRDLSTSRARHDLPETDRGLKISSAPVCEQADTAPKANSRQLDSMSVISSRSLPYTAARNATIMGRNTRRKRLLRAQASLETRRQVVNLLDLPHDVIHEILLHLQPDEGYQWHEVQDRCFVRSSRTQDLVALSGTCKTLRRLYDAVQLRIVCVRNTRKDMKRTLKVLSDDKRWYVRYAYIIGVLDPQRLTSRLRSIVFIPDHGTSVKPRVLKKPINYAAFLAHFPNLAAVRNTTSLIPHQTSSLKPLPNLDTLDVVLPSPLLNSSTSKPTIIRKLVLRHAPHAVAIHRPSGRALARTIESIAQHVEEIWLHLDSTVVYETGTSSSGRKKNGKKVLPALMDCAAKVKWQSLRRVGLVINPDLWIPVEGEPLTLVSLSISVSLSA